MYQPGTKDKKDQYARDQYRARIEEIHSTYPRDHLQGQEWPTTEARQLSNHYWRRLEESSSNCTIIDEEYQGFNRDEIVKRQTTKQRAKYELKEQRARAEADKYMGGQQLSSEESIARRPARDLIDMDLVGENLLQETVVGLSHKIGVDQTPPDQERRYLPI